jgi:SAM-dependent methyltransferase
MQLSLAGAKKILPIYLRDRYRIRWYELQFHVRNSFGRLIRVFWRPPFPEKNKGINLHLGCGRINHPGFINVDGAYFPHVHYIRALDNLAPFGDNSVDFVYASHCLEHFPFEDTQRVLEEWHRVLRRGGVARISVPDFDVLVGAYLESGSNVGSVLAYILGGQGNKYNHHYSLFTKRSLTLLLLKVGFKEVRGWAPGQDELGSIHDSSSATIIVAAREIPLSLNLEAVK